MWHGSIYFGILRSLKSFNYSTKLAYLRSYRRIPATGLSIVSTNADNVLATNWSINGLRYPSRSQIRNFTNGSSSRYRGMFKSGREIISGNLDLDRRRKFGGLVRKVLRGLWRFSVFTFQSLSTSNQVVTKIVPSLRIPRCVLFQAAYETIARPISNYHKIERRFRFRALQSAEDDDRCDRNTPASSSRRSTIESVSLEW